MTHEIKVTSQWLLKLYYCSCYTCTWTSFFASNPGTRELQMISLHILKRIRFKKFLLMHEYICLMLLDYLEFPLKAFFHDFWVTSSPISKLLSSLDEASLLSEFLYRSLSPVLQHFEQNITATPQSLNRACGAVIRSKCLSSVVWGFSLIQLLPGSLRDLVAEAAVSDHFQLGLHFAPHVP